MDAAFDSSRESDGLRGNRGPWIPKPSSGMPPGKAIAFTSRFRLVRQRMQLEARERTIWRASFSILVMRSPVRWTTNFANCDRAMPAFLSCSLMPGQNSLR